MDSSLQGPASNSNLEAEQLAKLREVIIYYRKQNQPERAASVARLALDIATASYRPYNGPLLLAMMDLSRCYVSCKSRPPEAQEICRQALTACEKSVGYSHTVTLEALTHVIDVVESKSLPSDYEKLIKRALHEYERLHNSTYEARPVLMAKLGASSLIQGRLDEAAEIFLQRLMILKAAKGEEHPDTLVATKDLAAIYLELCYSMAYNKAPPDDVQLFFKPIIRVIELCLESPSLQQILLYYLGRMLLFYGDDLNASIALPLGEKGPALRYACAACFQFISHNQYLAACRDCKYVGLCRSCYDIYNSNRASQTSLPKECISHRFLEIPNGQDQEVDVRIWLQQLHDSKLLESTEQQILQQDPRNLGGLYDGESSQAQYDFRLPEGLPEGHEVGRLRDKPAAWLEAIEKWFLSFRIMQIQEQVPQMLDNWFTSDGYQRRQLPQWKFEAEQTAELERHVTAIFRLALGPSVTESRSNEETVQGCYSSNDLYTHEDLVLNPELPEIRVLQITSCDDKMVRARMSRINIQSSSNYDALSYVWGTMDLSKQKLLEVNQRTIEIGPNLHAALCSLYHDGTLRRLWVDAVCINQADVLERSNQVAMMAQIYRGAVKVRIYLGSDLPLLSRYFEDHERNHATEGSMDEATTTPEQLEGALINEYIDFIARPWWTRVWILQEYTLAKQDPIMYLGSVSFKASTVGKLERKLSYESQLAALPFSGIQIHSRHPIMTISQESLQVRSILNSRHDERGGATLLTRLSLILEKYPRLQSTDPRDRIYGLLELLEPTVQAIFRPDYTINIATLYEQLATWLLVFDKDEEIFWRYPLKLGPEYPSWVPDFSRPLSSNLIESQDSSSKELKVNRSLMLTMSELRIDYLPSGNIKGAPPIVYNRVLATGGRYIDSIDRVFPLEGGTWLERLSRLWHLDVYFTGAKHDESRYPSDLFSSLLESHGKDMLHRWTRFSKNANVSISFFSPGLAQTEYYHIVGQFFRQTALPLSEPYQYSQIQTGPGFIKALTQMLKQASWWLRGKSEEDRMREEQLFLSTALKAVMLRLLTLQSYLCQDLDQPLNFLGASLFDYDNLESQIKYLRVPRRDPLYLNEVEADIRTKLRSITAISISEPAETEAIAPPYGLPPPIYEELQAQVCDAVTEEEVTLRAGLLLRLAQELRKTAARTLSAKDEQEYESIRTTYFNAGEYVSVDTIATEFKATHQWVTADDLWRKWLKNIGCGVGITLSTALLLKYSSFSSGLSARMRTITNLLTLGTAMGTLFWLDPFHSPTLLTAQGEVNELVAENQRIKDKSRLTSVAQGKRVEYTRLTEEKGLQWQNRTFFVTKRGFVGLGTPGVTDIREGDKVIWLENAGFPMVVRDVPSTENLYLVGFSIVREFVGEDRSTMENFQKLRKRVFKFL